MKQLLFLILFTSSFIHAQTQIRGKVIDSNTKEPLPFATILTDTGFGELTNVEGNFLVKTREPFSAIRISYVGYESKTVKVNPEDKFISISLSPSVEALNEVLITARENPALQLIRNAIAKKKENNIEKALNSFKFNAYNKILVTAHPDSISGSLDSLYTISKQGEKSFLKVDSTNYNFKKEITKQHMYIAEKISEYTFEKGKKKKETVLASRMAGLKQPIYELLGITLQDFSFYNESYAVFGTEYTNPIAKNALKEYNYKILDTVNNGIGESYMIYFKPKEKREFIGLEGVLYLDTNSFALTNVIAELKGFLNVKATQSFEYFEQSKIWFPKEMDVVLDKGDSKEAVNLFGGILQFTESQRKDSIVGRNKVNPSDVAFFISKTSNTNIQIDIPVEVKNSAATMEFDDDVAKQDEEFWNTYRTDSLTKRGATTYKKLDSIGEAENVDKYIDLGRNVLKGYYPTKYINIDLGKTLNFNNYEGFRIGVGGITNNNFSSKFKLEAYVAYGTKDNDFKYSLSGFTRLDKRRNTWLGLGYTSDLKEAAGLNFINKNNDFSIRHPRNFNLEKFYKYQVGTLSLTHDFQPNVESKLDISTGDYEPMFNYAYNLNGNSLSEYKLSTATLAFQFNPGSEYMYAPVGKVQTKEAYPQFTFQIEKSFDGLLDGELDFTRLQLQATHKIERLGKSTTSFVFEGGLAFGDIPVSHLFNASPNYKYSNPWIKRVNFAGNHSFETMAFNEFLSDSFAALHIIHAFKPFGDKRSNPRLSLVTRAAFGSIDDMTPHEEIEFKSLEHGFYESGFRIDSIWNGFGFGAFYRYGPYGNEEWSDNLSAKITYKFQLLNR